MNAGGAGRGPALTPGRARADALTMKIEDRWALGRLLARQRRLIARAPVVEVTASAEARIDASAAAVWRTLTRPADALRLTEGADLLACTVPGTPDGAVGEVSAVAVDQRDGTFLVVLGQSLLVEPARRLVTGTLTGAAPTVTDVTLTPLGEGACSVRVAVQVRTPVLDGAPLAEDAEPGLRRLLWRLEQLTCGGAAAGAEPPWPPAVPTPWRLACRTSPRPTWPSVCSKMRRSTRRTRPRSTRPARKAIPTTRRWRPDA